MAGPIRGTSLWPYVVGAIVLFALLLPGTPALAQEPLLRGFLQRLFQREEFPPPPQQVRPRKPAGKSSRNRSSRRGAAVAPNRAAPRAAARPEPQEAPKKPDARIVLVVGDFLAGGLAEGLEAAYAQNPNVRVVSRSNGSSGFVRDDFYDWPEEIPDIVEAAKPAVVVVMLGSNDRQSMRTATGQQEKLSTGWLKEYEDRADRFAAAVRQHGVPLIWVGMPAFKSDSMTADMLALNDIYRRVAQKASGEFVDIWDGFTDENGGYISTGPDINGQPVALRGRDGINITPAGRRKVAFYVEKPLNKILGGDAPSSPAVWASKEAPAPASVDPATIERTPPIALSGPALDDGAELLGATVTNGRTMARPATLLLAPGAVPGRADDFTTARPPRPSADPRG